MTKNVHFIFHLVLLTQPIHLSEIYATFPQVQQKLASSDVPDDQRRKKEIDSPFSFISFSDFCDSDWRGHFKLASLSRQLKTGSKLIINSHILILEYIFN